MRHYARPLIGAIIGFVFFALLSLLISNLYYRFMPGEWFVNYYSVRALDSEIGKDVQITSCRTLRADNIRFNATRTFMLKSDGHDRFNPVGEYQFNAGLEKLESSNCQLLRIPVERQPQEAGTYKIVTEGSFNVGGHLKNIRYESNEYKITPTIESIEAQINELQRQIDELRNRQSIISMRENIKLNGAEPIAESTPSKPQNNTPDSRPPETPEQQPEPESPSALSELNGLIRNTISNLPL